MALTLTGVNLQQIGDQYDCALGYTLDGVNAKMVGYVLKQGTAWTETTDLQDSDRLVQIASPNSTDRFTFYPKVSQGDWSGGERQVTYVDPARYYSSDGMLDMTQPGNLKLQPNFTNITVASDSSALIPRAAAATDGGNVYLLNGGATNPVLRINPDGTTTFYGVGAGVLLDILYSPANVFYMAGNGLWRTPPGSTATTQVTNDGAGAQWQAGNFIEAFGPLMAMVDGTLYYVDTNFTIRSVTSALGAAPGTLVKTVPTWAGRIVCLTTGGTGVLYATTGAFDTTTWSKPFSSVYSFDGTTATLVATVPGRVLNMYTVEGVTYLLAIQQQNLNSYNPALFALSGSTLSTVDDLRWVPTDFQNSLMAPPLNGIYTTNYYGMWSDGTYLYVGFPGLRILRYNISTGAVYNVGQNSRLSAANIHSHGLIGGASGWVEYTGHDYDAGTHIGTLDINLYNNPTGSIWSGSFITSTYDFGTPNTVKLFRSIDMEFSSLPVGTSVGVEYRLDGTTAWTALAAQNLTPTILTYLFPAASKGSRVQFRLTPVGALGALTPVVRSYSINARLGRVWKGQLQCFRNQLLRDAQDDQQGLSGQQLLGNVQNAYALAAGHVVLFVPSPTQAAGVEQVNAVLEDYSWEAMTPGPRSSDQAATDIEGLITVTLVEAL